MKQKISIDQAEALGFGLNVQQAVLLDYLRDAQRWAEPVIRDGREFVAISKRQIVQSLPLLTTKPDTAYRLLKVLEAKGLVELSHNDYSTLIRLTEKGAGDER